MGSAAAPPDWPGSLELVGWVVLPSPEGWDPLVGDHYASAAAAAEHGAEELASRLESPPADYWVGRVSLRREWRPEDRRAVAVLVLDQLQRVSA